MNLLAGRGSEIWRVALDGSASQKVMQPEERSAGFATRADGTVAVTIGVELSLIFSMPLR